MKTTLKKALAVFTAAVIVCMMFGFTAAASDKKELRFNDDGRFTVLNICDIQDRYPLMSITRDFIKDTLDRVHPDLVILGGDNISGGSNRTKALSKAAINEFMSIFEKAGVPVAAVFGNHDDENNAADKAYQMECYKSYSCYVGDAGEAGISGCGNTNLPILSSDGTRYAFNIWLTDSGTYNTENDLGGYEAVHEDQIDWYKRTSAALTAQNGGVPVPAFNFQHIVVPEVFDVITKDENGKWVLPEGSEGEVNETPCPPKFTHGQFDAFLETGDVIATVSGHDHVNNYRVNYKGIDIINTPGMGFRSYNSEVVGSRVFVIDENNPRDYETYCLSYFDIYSHSDAYAQARFDLNSRVTDDATKFSAFFRLIAAAILKVFGLSGVC